MHPRMPWFNTGANTPGTKLNAGSTGAAGVAPASEPQPLHGRAAADGGSGLLLQRSRSAAAADSGTASLHQAAAERRLREQLDATCFLVDQLREELQQRSAVVTQLRSELEEERARAERLEKESCHIRTHAAVIRRARGSAAVIDAASGSTAGPQLVGSMTSMEDDKLRQTSEMARLEAELESMRHLVRALQNDIHRKSGALRKLEKELKDRVLRVNQLEEEVATQRTAVESLRGQLQQSRQDAVAAIAKTGNSPKANTASAVAALASQQQLRQAVETADAATSPLARESDGDTGRAADGPEFAAVQQELDFVAGQLKRANQDLNSRACLLQTLEQQLRLEMENSSHLESELQHKTAALTEVAADLTEKLDTIASLQTMLHRLTGTLEELEAELAPSRAGTSVASDRSAVSGLSIEGLERSLRRVQEELRSKSMQLLTLQNEVQAKTVQVSRLEEELAGKSNAVTALEEESQRLRSALSALQKRLVQSEADLQRKDAKCATLQKHIDGLTARVSELEAAATQRGEASPKTIGYFRSQIEALQAALTSANHEARRKAGLLDKVYTTNQARVGQLEEELLYTRRELAYLRHKLTVRKAKRQAAAAAAAAAASGHTGSSPCSSGVGSDGGLDSPCFSSGGTTPNSISTAGDMLRAYSISPLSSPKHSAGFAQVFATAGAGGGSSSPPPPTSPRGASAKHGPARAATLPATASAPSLAGAGTGSGAGSPSSPVLSKRLSTRHSFSFSAAVPSPRSTSAMRQAALLKGAAAALRRERLAAGSWAAKGPGKGAAGEGTGLDLAPGSGQDGSGSDVGSPGSGPTKGTQAGRQRLAAELEAGYGGGVSSCGGSVCSSPCASPSAASGIFAAATAAAVAAANGRSPAGSGRNSPSSVTSSPLDTIEFLKAASAAAAAAAGSDGGSPASAKSAGSVGARVQCKAKPGVVSAESTPSNKCLANSGAGGVRAGGPTHELLQGPMFSPAASPTALRALATTLSPLDSPAHHKSKVLSPYSGSPRQWTDIGEVKRQLMSKLLLTDADAAALTSSRSSTLRKFHPSSCTASSSSKLRAAAGSGSGTVNSAGVSGERQGHWR